jgi:alpha-glucosidase
MYYGDEIGLARVDIPRERIQDPWEKNEPGLGVSRDPSRTPQQWDASMNAGFTSGTPWLPVDMNYPAQNVAQLSTDRHSLLWLYRFLIDIRRQHCALSIGDARVISADHDVLMYERICADERIIVALNFGQDERPLNLPETAAATLLLSTALDREGAIANATLRGDEGAIFLLGKPSS